MAKMSVPSMPVRSPARVRDLRAKLAAAAVGVLAWSVPSAASAYQVVVGLGSTADKSATIAMADRSAWPVVADNSWGPLANLVPIGTLPRSQQKAVFDNFKNKLAISELPYPSIRWTSSQPDMDFVQSFGFTIPYVFVLYEYDERVKIQGKATADSLAKAGVIDSMLTRDEILKVKGRFPKSTLLMNTRSWTRNRVYLESVQDVLQGITIEFMANSTPDVVAKEVAPFAVWAHKLDKHLMILLPPMPTDNLDDRYVKSVTTFAQALYDANRTLLPAGWMARNKILFAPANYTWATSLLTYIPEDGKNTVLAAAKQLLAMRAKLEASPAPPDAGVIDGGTDAASSDSGSPADAAAASDATAGDASADDVSIGDSSSGGEDTGEGADGSPGTTKDPDGGQIDTEGSDATSCATSSHSNWSVGALGWVGVAALLLRRRARRAQPM